MKASDAALQLKVPRNKTALMQHLQLLVVRHHYWWCGGIIKPSRLAAFAAKMASRYRITRPTRGRAYDRIRGRAAVHLVVFPVGENNVAWWLLSDEGKCGLNDPASPDAHMAKNAMASDGHIFFTDYVLLYAHKKDARKLTDAKTGREKLVLKDRSTWTWKLTDAALNEVKASLERAVANLEYGDEGGNGRRPWGVLGILACQRERPLFSGVRNHVIAVHRHADTHWGRVKRKWQGQNFAQLAPGAGRDGELRNLKEIIGFHLPKMTRIKVYGDAPKAIGEIASSERRPGDLAAATSLWTAEQFKLRAL
ncbi:MAG: hypothetical protein JWR22_2858 [Herminiimonas sp.]|nr:hypothetical protein [Herminiimonas sp.]